MSYLPDTLNRSTLATRTTLGDGLDFFAKYGLLAVFISLISTPLGNPVPEDISLLAGGMLAGMGQTNVWVALVVGYAGVIIGDCIAFAMGRRVGLKPGGFLSRAVGNKHRTTAALLRAVRRSNNPHLPPASRLQAPLLFHRGRLGHLLSTLPLIDGTAALVTANVFTWLGYHYAEDLGNVIAGLGRFRQVMTGVLVLAIGLVAYRVILYQIERRQVKREEREGRAGTRSSRLSRLGAYVPL